MASLSAIERLVDKALNEQKRLGSDLSTLRAALRDLSVSTAREHEIRVIEERFFLAGESIRGISSLALDASCEFRQLVKPRAAEKEPAE